MIGAGFIGYTQLAAQKSCGKLSDQFFVSISFIAVGLALDAVQALLRAGPVRDFVQQGGVVSFSGVVGDRLINGGGYVLFLFRTKIIVSFGQQRVLPTN